MMTTDTAMTTPDDEDAAAHDLAAPQTAPADVAPLRADGVAGIVAILRRAIERQGRITFAEFMRIALYDPGHGYYQSPERRPGRGGDFLTAPELHPFFGLALARQIAECWDRLGNPAPFTVREHGAGIGGLAYDIIVGLLDRRPEIRSALRYELVEVNPHRSAQAMVAMREVGFGEIVRAVEPGPEAAQPAPPITGVVIANEVADALPVHRLQWNGTAFEELWVTWGGDRFVETGGDLSAPLAAPGIERPLQYLARQGIDPGGWPVGARIEISPAAGQWIAGVARGIARGYA
ncbi:MAG: SAM-dependent methyltransferase, partial [Chloroflexia bacterium]|nr:SAM-dependent methyltransferase [Chloroflexia bacterium]